MLTKEDLSTFSRIMKSYTFFILFLTSLSYSQDKHFSFEGAQLFHDLNESRNPPIQKIQLDLEMEIQSIKKYWSKNEFTAYYIKNLDKSNTDPERYITYSSLPEIHSPKYLMGLFYQKTKDLGYSMYHDGKKSSVVVPRLPSYGKFPYQKTLDSRPMSSFLDGKEVEKVKFKFYTSVDSVKLLYSYSYPEQVDTIRLKVDDLNQTNPYGLTLKRYKDYGIAVDLPYNNQIEIVDVAGIDKDGKPLLSNVLDSYYNMASNEQSQRQIRTYKQMIIKLYSEIAEGKITTTNEFKAKLLALEREYEWSPDWEKLIKTKKYLLQIFGYAEEVVLYVKTKTRFIHKGVVVANSELAHPIYDYFTNEDLDYDQPGEFFYNKQTKKKMTEQGYRNIYFIGGNFFRVESINDECKRLIVNQEGQLEYFDDCSGKLTMLNNGGVLIEYTDRYGDNQDSVKIYDKNGSLKLTGENCNLINEIFKETHFIALPVENKVRFMLEDYTLTDTLDNYHIYSTHKALVLKDDKFGVIDDNGRVLVPFEYTDCQIIGQNHILVVKDGKQQIISDNNEIKFEENEHQLGVVPVVENSMGFNIPYLNLVTFEENDLLGIKDINGKVVFPPKAKGISEIGYNRIVIRLENDLIGVIDKDGNEIIPFKYNDINPYYRGYTILVNSDSTGTEFTFFDYNGTIKATYKAEVDYEIWNVLGKPTLIIDSKTYIRYNGEISEQVE